MSFSRSTQEEIDLIAIAQTGWLLDAEQMLKQCSRFWRQGGTLVVRLDGDPETLRVLRTQKSQETIQTEWQDIGRESFALGL